eukprot:CAMPEP_0181519692 /NCGR_PEP_ID=MMETSP1110-20121109/65919_1 /TAXON_ID=174948 /ORGANISM="Symbiodinium sp., Strain CCMP421" /LENGTH=59 /DNA_ID=CAMNT_0023650145 /DNA_START=136 /DNA_END=315 /DNA_ORIENTATION=-
MCKKSQRERYLTIPKKSQSLSFPFSASATSGKMAGCDTVVEISSGCPALLNMCGASWLK